MTTNSLRSRLAASTILCSATVLSAIMMGPAFSQTANTNGAAPDTETVVVTGSRGNDDDRDYG